MKETIDQFNALFEGKAVAKDLDENRFSVTIDGVTLVMGIGAAIYALGAQAEVEAVKCPNCQEPLAAGRCSNCGYGNVGPKEPSEAAPKVPSVEPRGM